MVAVPAAADFTAALPVPMISGGMRVDLRPVFYVVRGSVCWSAIHSPVPRPNRRLSSEGLNFRRVTQGRTPRIAECLRISRLRRPFAKKAPRQFTFCFVKQESELAGQGVGIHLLVPPPLFAHTKPLDDAAVFFRGQAFNSGLDLFDSAHAWSLSPWIGGPGR